MPTLLDWTLEAIREETSDFSWMEERRHEWTPLVANVLQRIINGETILLLTDPPRLWFEHYVLNAINLTTGERPFFPVQRLRGVFSDLQGLDNHTRITLLHDMLDIAYPQGYFVWYIGEGSHPYTKLAYHNDNNFLWLINEEMAGSFLLKSGDPLLDIKLLQLYRLFDQSLDAALFGHVELS
jgi:hypothetical protein